MEEASQLWGDRHNYCPDPEDRNIVKQGWTCDQYFEFNDYEVAYQVVGLVSKSYQIGLFTILLFILFARRYDGSSKREQLSVFPLVITGCTLANSVFSLLRVNALFPIWSSEAHLSQMVVLNGLDALFQMVAFLIFALKYHETAWDIKLMLQEEIEQLNETRSTSVEAIQAQRTARQKVYRTVMWLNVAFICLTQSLLIASFTMLAENNALALAVFALSCGVAEDLTICFVLAWSLSIFVSIVRSLQPRFVMNKFPIIFNIVTLTLWSLVNLVEEIFLIKFYGNLEAYELISQMAVLNSCGFALDMLLYTSLAYVLYKMSAGQTSKQHEDVSLLVYASKQSKYQTHLRQAAQATGESVSLKSRSLHTDDLPSVTSFQTGSMESMEHRMIQETQAATLQAKKVYGAPNLHIKDGMLSIFIRPDASTQVIHFKDMATANRGIRTNSTPRVEAYLDLGSLRETILYTETDRNSKQSFKASLAKQPEIIHEATEATGEFKADNLIHSASSDINSSGRENTNQI